MATTQFDSAVELQLDILRVGATTQRKIIKLLQQMERDLVGRIAADNMTEWGKARATKQLAQIKAVIKTYYDDAAGIAASSTSAIAEVSARVTAQSLAVSVADAVLPTDAMLASIVNNSLIQGAAQGEWWTRQGADTSFRFAQAVRMGMASSETNQQIIARVRQFMDTSRANAAALVQTSVATIANDSRMAVFAANDDIIKRYRAVATLDTHTCTQCAPLDGLEWQKDGKPIGHKFQMPSYPLHFNCRCLKIAVVLDGPQGGKRASDGGPVSASLTFSGWLERQSKEKQESILGKGRTELYRKKKITLADLVTGNGKPLTVEQLRKKYK